MTERRDLYTGYEKHRGEWLAMYCNVDLDQTERGERQGVVWVRNCEAARLRAIVDARAESSEMRVTDEQARILADGDYEPVVQIGIGTTINMAHLAADLLDARAEIASLRVKLAAVCEAASATQRAFEEQADRDRRGKAGA